MDCISVLCESNYIDRTVHDDPNKKLPATTKQINYIQRLLAKSYCKYKLCDNVDLHTISKYHANYIIKVLLAEYKHNYISAKYIYKN